MRTRHLGIGGCSGLTEMGELSNVVTRQLKFSLGAIPSSWRHTFPLEITVSASV